MTKRQESYMAFSIGGALLAWGLGLISGSDNFGSLLLSVSFMVIPGTIIGIYGIYLFNKSKK